MVAAADPVRARLKQWPRAVGGEPRLYAEAALGAICSMFGAPRAVLAWEDPEEPWVVIAALNNGEFLWREEAGLLDSACETLRKPDMLEIPLEGEHVQGRVFCAAAMQEWTPQLADIVALLVARDMESVISARNASREAVHEERLRVARDLHDGLLQSFTGVVLQLETVHDMIESKPEDAQSLITKIQGLIMADQRDLRSYVEQLRPRRRIDVPFDFLSRLSELKSRFETQWGINVTIREEGIDPLVAQSLGPETFRLIQEAVTNAAKHGSASHIRVQLSTRESRIWIDVSDDGHGFPFHGKRTLQEIRESGVGPSMLAERVAALNGELTVDSSGAGAKIQISIPLGFSGA
jgi:signal transduction histidine kinase